MSLIREKVKKIIKKYDTNNPYEIAEQLNIHVHALPLHEELNGFYKLEQRNRFIVINHNLSEEMQKFVCAHELGHALLHPRTNTTFLRNRTYFSVDKIEVEANTFAVELLLPDSIISEYSNTNLTIYEACAEYGIPSEMARLKKLK